MIEINENTEVVIKTFHGLEEVLAKECEMLGATNVQPKIRAVSCNADLELIYKLNYCCRTALRVLIPIHQFECTFENDLYEGCHHFEWTNIFDVKNTFAISATLVNSHLTHTQYASLKAKDGIVDYFRKKLNSRPDVDPDKPDILIQIHISHNKCTIYIDSSNTILYKRGWRLEQHKAPLNEVLAAGILHLAEYSGQTPLLDFMCGSGTIAIEALMMAKQIPAGYYRNDFGFMKWNNYDKALWAKVVEEANARIQKAAQPVYASDINFYAIDAALKNAYDANLDDQIIIEKKDFRELSKPHDSGIIVTNPPYNIRIEEEELIALYKDVGNTLKRNFSGWKAFILAGDLHAAKFIGLKPSRKQIVFNGPIECRLLTFNLFEGKKYQKKPEPEV
ncbi:MAG: class I SAM-dependent RNA methyltransferase [Bacteroidetes bacterium]|nr:class I SAM-dependent RNA methyltransferase [Bacteroidota bacterium]